MKDLYGKKEKHDHKLTNILKFVIFAIVMLAPFIAILSKIVYVSANKNAKDSYYGETINEEQNIKVNSFKDMIPNNTYIWANPIMEESTENDIRTYLYVTNVILNYNTTIDPNEVIRLAIYTYGNATPFIRLYDENENTLGTYGLKTESINITFKYLSGQNLQYNENLCWIYYTEYNKDSYLDNVFYYAVDQSKESELLKWTKDTPIYNVINSMNTGLGLSANHILTYLLTYWSIILAIYIVFDIIIFVFTKITHYLQ